MDRNRASARQQSDWNAWAAGSSRATEIERLKRELEESRARERHARHETAETRERFERLLDASRRFTHTLSERRRHQHTSRRYLSVQHTIDSVLLEADGLEDAAAGVLKALGENLGWQVIVLWVAGEETLRYLEIWHRPNAAPDGFEAACLRTRCVRGEGLPGIAWSENRPVWAAERPRLSHYRGWWTIRDHRVPGQQGPAPGRRIALHRRPHRTQDRPVRRPPAGREGVARGRGAAPAGYRGRARRPAGLGGACRRESVLWRDGRDIRLPSGRVQPLLQGSSGKGPPRRPRARMAHAGCRRRRGRTARAGIPNRQTGRRRPLGPLQWQGSQGRERHTHARARGLHRRHRTEAGRAGARTAPLFGGWRLRRGCRAGEDQPRAP